MKTAFVTGASYGVGAATALALAREGFDLALSATRAENLEGTIDKVKETGVRTLPLQLDLRDQASIERAIAETVAAFGSLDLLVNNAGTNLRKLAVEVTRAQWDDMISVNVAGTFFITRQVARHFIASGTKGGVINIASVHAFVGSPERSVYGICKAAMVQMTRMLAVEWAEHGIRVNAVAPGRLETGSPSRRTTPEYMRAMLDKIPLHRLSTAEEVAAAVCYLASPAAASVTGQVLVLDGGLTAT
jgi:NAD(P)-dependent dehydrogenase (short-subunit alcohol dehydrogenase family)